MNMMRALLLFCAISATLLASADNGVTFSSNRTDFRDESIYFLMTTRFYDGDPSNNVLCWDNQEQQKATKDPCWRGDFKGIIDKLDYIKALGFTSIWITPVVENASGYDYHGYHAMSFERVDSRYQSRIADGATEDVDFQKLIDAAHAKGIKIILDIVLNHTGNFGESFLCPTFTRSTKVTAQGSADYSLSPNLKLLGNDYLQLNPSAQYQRRLALMKNTDGKNHDKNNYWHHFGNFNWDDDTRWWAQIAGDCVDLNTENPAVYNYLVKCYGSFIKMGVDGFRIDTSGHIARLTFNKAFIPQFKALGEQYASKRLLAGQTTPTPFYMFGEVCARYSGPVYRGQSALSPFFYTWASEHGGKTYPWSSDVSEYEGKDFPVGEGLTFSDTNRNSCEAEYTDYKGEPGNAFSSENALLQGNNYHKPDYKEASGFNVIDFPMHWNFGNYASAWTTATGNDRLYNDATWNVVYVDSHDYGPDSDNRYNGGTAAWAENMDVMWLLRGIPCIYYGSEVEFQAGAPCDKGPNGPLANTGRAYYGQNLMGNVSAENFGLFQADGQVKKTLEHPLARHLQALNRIRQAVPALRKGQYSTEGCSSNGGRAWKKRYTSGDVDSYVLVCMNGDATFTGIENGTYKDAVTGDVKTVHDGNLSVSCAGRGNARVYVLGGTFSLGEDGPFLYATSPAQADQSALATDEGTTWVEATPVTHPAVEMTPEGCTFRTETLDIDLKLKDATSGWYRIDNGNKVEIHGDMRITIGSDMRFGDTKTIQWEAKGMQDGEEETTNGEATYKKVDPNSMITVYVHTTSTASPKLYAWTTTNGTTTELNGAWPGKVLTNKTRIGTTDWYSFAVEGKEAFNLILNDGNGQTKDILNITQDTYFEYAGGANLHRVSKPSGVQEQPVKPQPQGECAAYFINDRGWNEVYAWVWNGDNVNENYTGGQWPGVVCTPTDQKKDGFTIWKWTYTGQKPLPNNTKIIFNCGTGGNVGTVQTADLDFKCGTYYNSKGQTAFIPEHEMTQQAQPIKVYNLQGYFLWSAGSMEEAVRNAPAGVYIIGGKRTVIK